MPVSVISIAQLFELRNTVPCVDVRSPAEYLHAHIPNAFNIPLLNNEERAIVGTIYKQHGNRAAVIKGYELVGSKFATYIEQAIAYANNNELIVHCWRGGMRSNIMANLFSNAGVKVYLLNGGYKLYRQHVLKLLGQTYNLYIIGGKTGCDKTSVLKELQLQHAHVIDLESIANHRGSAFGALGLPPQPSSEMAENLIATALHHVPIHAPLFMENESSKIGTVNLNDKLVTNMRKAPSFVIDRPQDQRMQIILREYGNFPVDTLIACTQKLRKRLGGLRLQQAVDCLSSSDFEGWLSILLPYYDATYAHSTAERAGQIYIAINAESLSNKHVADAILQMVNDHAYVPQ